MMREGLMFVVVCFSTTSALADSIEVNAKVLTDTPESLAAASNPKSLQAQLRDSMDVVYYTAGLPTDLQAGVSVEGSIQNAVVIPGTSSSPTTTPRPVIDGGSDNSPVLIASLVVGVVGLLGIAAWAVLRSRGGKPNNNPQCTPPVVIPVTIDPSTIPPRPPPQPPPAPYCYPQPQIPASYSPLPFIPPPVVRPPVRITPDAFPPPTTNPTVPPPHSRRFIVIRKQN